MPTASDIVGSMTSGSETTRPTNMSDLQNNLQRLADSVNLDEEDTIQEEIRLYAEENPVSFIMQVREIPIENISYLADIYETLSTEPEHWSEFFLEEIDRLIELSRTNSEEEAILAPLDAYLLLSFDEENNILNHDLLVKFAGYLDDESPVIRRSCVDLVGDFVSRSDFKILSKLERIVESDPDWRVRFLAHRALEDVHPERAARTKLPLWIRIRARYSNLNYG
jgi:hypothetical protein